MQAGTCSGKKLARFKEQGNRELGHQAMPGLRCPPSVMQGHPSCATLLYLHVVLPGAFMGLQVTWPQPPHGHIGHSL